MNFFSVESKKNLEGKEIDIYLPRQWFKNDTFLHIYSTVRCPTLSVLLGGYVAYQVGIWVTTETWGESIPYMSRQVTLPILTLILNWL